MLSLLVSVLAVYFLISFLILCILINLAYIVSKRETFKDYWKNEDKKWILPLIFISPIYVLYLLFKGDE